MKTIAKTTKENAKVYALIPCTENRKSYGGRAHVIVTKTGYILLQSYGTIVAVISPKKKFYRTWCNYSVTTMKHVNDFCFQHRLSGYNKKSWLSLPVYRCGIKPYPVIFEDCAWNDYLVSFKFLGGVSK